MLESLFNNVAGLQEDFIKRTLQHRYFFEEKCEIFINALFYRTPPMAASKNTHKLLIDIYFNYFPVSKDK